MKRGAGELVERGQRRTDAHARVGPQVLPDPLQPSISLRRLDPHHQVVDAVGQQPLGRLHDTLGRQVRRPDRDHVLRNGEAAAGTGVAEVLVRDQVGDLQSLDPEQALLALPILRPAPLVPRERLSHGNENSPERVGAVPELGILRSPADERLVEPAGGLMELATDSEVARRHDAEDVVVPRRQLVGSRHVAFEERRIRRTAREQVLQRPRPSPDRLGVDAVHRDMGAEPERQQT